MHIIRGAVLLGLSLLLSFAAEASDKKFQVKVKAKFYYSYGGKNFRKMGTLRGRLIANADGSNAHFYLGNKERVVDIESFQVWQNSTCFFCDPTKKKMRPDIKINFNAYTLVNIMRDANRSWYQSKFLKQNAQDAIDHYVGYFYHQEFSFHAWYRDVIFKKDQDHTKFTFHFNEKGMPYRLKLVLDVGNRISELK